MKFSEMPYARPDAAAVKTELASLTAAFRAAKSFDEADGVFVKEDRLDRHIDTLYNLSYIRHSIDTRDEFYSGEAAFWDETLPTLQEALQPWVLALLESPYRKELEEKYGKVPFVNAEIRLRSFTPALVPLMQEENALTTEYEKLLASAKIPFEGKTYTLSQISPCKSDPDDDRRLAAWKAEGQWYMDNADKLDGIYDRLVKLRTEEGKLLGHENFVPLGYDRMERNCYDKTDVARFREAVVKYLVPIADSVYRAQAKRLGKAYPMTYADNALMFRSGNPKPAGSPDEIVAEAQKLYDALSPETSEFFTVMREQELMDLLSTEGKEAGGYCTSIHDYEVPFIFANFNGTADDVETVTHEAGHAFAGWLNRRRVPSSTVWPSLEACEVHSMSMEFFAWQNTDGFFGKDARKFFYSHLAGAVRFIPYGTLVDHFQHSVYEHPEMTPAERHAEWARLSGVYMPWARLEEIPFYGDGRAWQRQHHIYSSPFYYIDYCLAQTVALEFWARRLDDPEKAWQTYMDYTAAGGSLTFTDLLAHAGLESPFDGNCLKHICEKAKAWLEAYDLDGIE